MTHEAMGKCASRVQASCPFADPVLFICCLGYRGFAAHEGLCLLEIKRRLHICC